MAVWKKKPLKDIGIITSGGTPSRKRLEYWGGDIPWVTTGEIGTGFILKTHEHITEQGLANSAAKIFPKNTLLIALYGQGKTRGTVAKLGIAAATNQACAALLVSEKHDSNYIFYCLQNSYQKLRRLSNSGTQKNLNAELLKNFQINVPLKGEQQKIASILSTWDAAIDCVQKLLENSRQQKKALMQQLLTGKRRLPGFMKRWRQFSLSDIATVSMGTSPPSNYYNFQKIGIPLIQGNADICNGKTSPRIYTTHITERCKKGDILISVRAPVGTIAKSGHVACIGRGICAVSAFLNSVHEYLFHWFVSFEDKWPRFSQGSTFDSISGKELRNLKIFLPDDELELKKIADILGLGDNLIENYQNQIELFKSQKQSLMQQLLTGKRRVKLDPAEIESE